MIQTILIIVLGISFLVLLIMFFLKASLLADIPCPLEVKEKEKIFTKIKKTLSKISIFKSSFWNHFFQKVLSKIRIVVLKIENKIGNCLSRLRKKTSKDQENSKKNTT